MTHGSLFAGIGGFDLGFERAGFHTKWQVEIEPFCNQVLAARFPRAARFDDIQKCGAHNIEKVDCITAGVPCQDVSVAGKRVGLAGERTGLFYEFARILQELRPAWFVFENVPGLFSSNRGRDFAEVLRVLMVECGYGVSWRVLNSQFFGVAQRRRRVFIVGCFGKPCPAEILFESAGGRRDIKKGGKARPRIAQWSEGGLAGAVASRDWKGADNIYAEEGKLVAHTLREYDGHNGHSSPRGDGCDNLVASTLRGGGDTPKSHGKPSGQDRATLVTALRHLGRGGADDNEAQGGHLVSAPPDADGVRDFAGLPQGLDSARYRALCNAVTVQVAEWIGRIIMESI